MPAATVYRSGPVAVGIHTGEVADLYANADALRPTGRPARGNAIYASPTLFGLTRWARALVTMYPSTDSTISEVRVKPEGLWVYSVDAWERASTTMGRTPGNFAAYWATGIPLVDWTRLAEEQALDPREWEVLVSADAVQSTRPVTNRRLITSIPEGDYSREQLMIALERRRWNRGVRW